VLKENQIQEVIKNLQIKGIPFREKISLSPLSSFKIGGISPLLVEPGTDNEIFSFLEISKSMDIPYKILGGGSNLLISDQPDEFIVLRLGGNYKNYSMISDGVFEIGGATNTTPTFRQISQKGYKGVEFLSTIPGWTGGAVIQNAGCYGGELLDFTRRIEFIRDGKMEIKSPKEIQYGYRSTEFLQQKDSIILRIEIELPQGDLEEIEHSLKEKREKRNSSQPENKKSAGSIFKNPTNLFENEIPVKAWQLIDRAGLRGLIQGGAQISPEHCNFIVNIGNATARDVHYLIQKIMETVEKNFGILLEREVEFFGTI
jgi:UDP-N-acetylmuramate dehydrogenase